MPCLRSMNNGITVVVRARSRSTANSTIPSRMKDGRPATQGASNVQIRRRRDIWSCFSIASDPNKDKQIRSNYLLFLGHSAHFPTHTGAMSSKHAKPTHSILQGRLHKKARLTNESPRKPSQTGTSSKPSLKAKLGKPQPPSPAKPKQKRGTHVPTKDVKGKAKATVTVNDEGSEKFLPASFKIIVGSYEKLLYGLEGTVSVEGTSHTYSIKPIFIFPAHISCIRAVAASPTGGKWLATGSGDELIKVWDLRRRKEIGGLMHHEGNVCTQIA